MSWLVAHWWVAPLALAVAAIPLSWYVEKRRRESYEEFCLMRGFNFERERPTAEQAYGAVPLFAKGRSRRWGYTIRGRWNGRAFTAFEYRYTTGGGKSSHTERFSVMLWEGDAVALPRFCCTPEGFFDRLAQRFGRQDLDFPEDPEFSGAYQLQGDDEAAVRGKFTPEVRRHLLANPRQHVAATGHALVWWRPGRLPKPDELDALFAEGDGVRRLFA
jgi:hypothetical protein